MDKEVLDRIKRVSNAPNVISGSTPVISFGDFTQSSVVTLSINPSSKEFLKGSDLIPLGKKRLVDFEILGKSHDEKITDNDADRIWKGCKDYFLPTSNPYQWFDDLESILKMSDISYKSGTASHLDLVQSATFPAWRALPLNVQRQLLKEDYEFFKYQVSYPRISAILINGRQVFEVAKMTPGFNLEIKERIEIKSGERTIPTHIFRGVGPNNKLVFGWTGTLKSLQISADERSSLYSKLADRLQSFLS